jgi:myosin heavy subunit
MLTIDGVDDAEEMKATDDAMNILGFSAVCLFKYESQKYRCCI